MPEETNQTKKLKCGKCQEWKPCSDFSKDNRSKGGYQTKCKLCEKQYYKENAEKIKQRSKQWKKENADYYKQQNKQYREENAEKIKQRSKQYREENVEKIKQRGKQYYKENTNCIKQRGKQHYKENSEHIKKYYNTPFNIDNESKKLEEIKNYEDWIVDNDNEVNFQCAYCGEYFKTTKQQIANRIHALNGRYGHGTEMRFYCSQQCKNECPIYHQSKYPKGYKPATSREVQPELRQMVLARDNYTCQKCNKHKDELDVGLHCHHIYPLNESPITSADVDTCITYCKDCHGWVHMNVAGCGYGEVRCSE